MTNRILAALVVPAICAAQAPTTLLPEQQAQHVLSRLAFGPRPGEIAKVRGMGVDTWIDLQLKPEKIDDKESDNILKRYRALGTETVDIERAFREAQQRRRQEQRMAAAMDSASGRPPNAQQQPPFNPSAQRELQNRVIQELYASRLARAVNSERQLYEVMVDFWENHFSVFVGKGQTRVYLLEYDRDIIRPRAMGKFRDLLGAVAHSPAMLFYLDNAQSRADSTHMTLAMLTRGRGRFQPMRPFAPPGAQQRRGLNENYARELMELHTLGVDGGYSQKDVIEVARALTGWTINPQVGAYVFNPAMHDADAKTILGVNFPAGRGEADGEQVLDLVAKHPSTARFITTKLARRFISDEPPPSVVDKCSKVFTKSDGDIRQVVGCIVKSPEFMSPQAYRAKVKTPFEVVVSAMRATGSELDLRPGGPQVVAFLGQPMFGRQTPDGWPDVGREWMNAGAILNRINFGLALAADRAPGIVTGTVQELEAVRDAPRDRQVDAVIRVFFGGQVSPETREILVTGENPFAARAAADSSDMPAMPPMGGPPGGPPVGRGGGLGRVDMSQLRLTGLDQVIGLALGAPEFQRR